MAESDIKNTQDSNAIGVVVQCPCSAWWDAGWRRAHLKHIAPTRSLTSERFMKIVRREHRACVRAANEPNDQTVPTSGADTRENYQTTKTMTEETDSQTTTHQPQRLAPVPCYALPPEGIRHLHDEAAKLEKQAIPLMSDGFLHDAYCKLEISHSLRVTANYCDGTLVNLA